MTQIGFGREYGLNRGNIDSYENGAEPKLPILLRITEENNIDLTDFISIKLTNENFSAITRKRTSQMLIQEPEAPYEKSEVYGLIREIEDTEDVEERRDISKKILVIVNELMKENSNLQKELMQLLKDKS